MPHTFHNIHTIRRSHNAALPVNHKATRMHAKIHLNERQVYSDNPNFFTGREKNYFSWRVNSAILLVEQMYQKDKEVLSYLKNLKSTYPDREVYIYMKERIYIFHPHECVHPHDCCYPVMLCQDSDCNCTRVFVPLDVLIDTYTSYCEQLDEELDFLDENQDFLDSSSFYYDECDYAILPKKSCKKTSHRILREKSLPNARLERQIKKQIFFKKSHKFEE